MLITNIDIHDKLFNSQFGTVKSFKKYADSNSIESIYVEFDDSTVGLSQKVKDNDEFSKCVAIQTTEDDNLVSQSGEKIT